MAKQNWFNIWYEDKQAMVSTMMHNMTADIDAGYNPMGRSIQKQLRGIREYAEKFDEEMKGFRTMSEGQIQHWCYYDLVRRGAITRTN